MITEIYIITSLIAFGICKGVSDGLAHTVSVNHHSRWWSSDGWHKYKYTLTGNCLIPFDYKFKWYYLGLYKPKHEERFPFSTTILSFTTDAWHFFNFIRYRIVYSYVSLILGFNIWWSLAIVFIFAPILVGVVFELIYKKVK